MTDSAITNDQITGDDALASLASVPPFAFKKDAAARAGMSVREFDRLRARGEGPPAHRIGGRLFFDFDELTAWGEARRRDWILDTGDAAG